MCPMDIRTYVHLVIQYCSLAFTMVNSAVQQLCIEREERECKRERERERDREERERERERERGHTTLFTSVSLPT